MKKRTVSRIYIEVNGIITHTRSKYRILKLNFGEAEFLRGLSGVAAILFIHLFINILFEIH